jgi:hypothetical protein
MTQENPSAEKIDPTDQRYFPRWNVQSRVIYHLGDERKSREAHTEDLSCSGASLWMDEIIQGRQPIDLTVYLTDTTKIKLQGNIVWFQRCENKTKVGITFFNTTSDTADLILEHAFRVDPQGYREHFFGGW